VPDPDNLPVLGDVIARPGFVPSDDCRASSATTAVDGYFGSLYARMKVQQQGSDRWICARLQPEGGVELAGGKFIVSGDGSAIGQDDNYGACSTEPDNVLPTAHPIRSGHLGDPNTPPYVPYLLDGYASEAGTAWVCLQAGPLGARTTFNGIGTAFSRDDPSLAASPPRTPWTPGKASSDCETRPGGSLTPLVNAQINGTQVWLDAWQSASRVQLCVRAAGANAAGGRLTLDAAGAPGVTPILTQGTDTGACGTDVFTDDQDQLYIRRSTGTNPASVCITRGGINQRFTVGFTGTPTAPLPSWTADN
jgi:hypothetical protein